MNGPGEAHDFSGYGFNIPAGARIDGIAVRLDWWLDSRSGSNSMAVQLSPDGGLTWTSALVDSREATREATTALGGPTETWGRTWQASELSHATFRVRVKMNSDRSTRDFFLDWVPVTVFHSGP